MKKITLIFFLVVTAISNLIGCAQQNKDKNMTINELTEEMKSNDNLIILDVRTEGELAGPLGKIDGVINIPIQELDYRIDELEEFKDKEIAVICRTGNRSHYATETLNEFGFKAKNVLGGMVEYRRNGN